MTWCGAANYGTDVVQQEPIILSTRAMRKSVPIPTELWWFGVCVCTGTIGGVRTRIAAQTSLRSNNSRKTEVLFGCVW